MAKKKAEAKQENVVDFIGKTVKSARYIGGENADTNFADCNGYGDLELTFTDGTKVTIHYSCMGGVYTGECK